MISTTSDTRYFIEEFDFPIYIYGAGRIGFRVAWFLKKCGIEFEGFLDIQAKDCDKFGEILVEDKLYKVESPYILTELMGTVRVITAVADSKVVYESINMMDLTTGIGSNVILLEPYNKSFDGEIEVNYNIMLSYFRSKLLTKNIPSIISNTCNAGFIYKYLGERVMFKTPTLNTHIDPQDFVKLCKYPKRYMSEEITFSHYTLLFGKRVAVGRVDDIYVYFRHDVDVNRSITVWNRLRKTIDYDNIVFIMEETIERQPITFQVANEFCGINKKNILITRTRMWGGLENVIQIDHSNFHERKILVEDWFDLIGWINGLS